MLIVQIWFFLSQVCLGIQENLLGWPFIYVFLFMQFKLEIRNRIITWKISSIKSHKYFNKFILNCLCLYPFNKISPLHANSLSFTRYLKIGLLPFIFVSKINLNDFALLHVIMLVVIYFASILHLLLPSNSFWQVSTGNNASVGI